MELRRIIGQCAPLFFMALFFDLTGFIVLLVGLSGAPHIGGRGYGDFLALTGAILMFFGVGMWVMWHAGNIGEDGKRSDLGRLARRLTERLGSLRGPGGKGEEEEEEQEEEEEEEEKKEKDGGKSEENAAYINEAYEPTDTETV
ncbi:transmembrane protein 238-like [Neoarius graeffei]|uniref:transmembrane protein 238-like n=1 Tax=Neoarius graeffei TaxID=443677 RepID=UPI00298C0FAA|nr:transmembrane protein 238-like [Neoarius graeffei]